MYNSTVRNSDYILDSSKTSQRLETSLFVAYYAGVFNASNERLGNYVLWCCTCHDHEDDLETDGIPESLSGL